MSCRQRLTPKRGVLLGSHNTKNQKRRRHVDQQHPAMARSGAAPMDASTQNTRPAQAIQAADAHLKVSSCIIKPAPI
jgi:hypothetical protein